MGPRIQQPLRALTAAERAHLAALVRASSERADVRQRAGTITVTDPEAEQKRAGSSRRTGERRQRA
jgi:hypothetical protein